MSCSREDNSLSLSRCAVVSLPSTISTLSPLLWKCNIKEIMGRWKVRDCVLGQKDHVVTNENEIEVGQQEPCRTLKERKINKQLGNRRERGTSTKATPLSIYLPSFSFLLALPLPCFLFSITRCFRPRQPSSCTLFIHSTQKCVMFQCRMKWWLQKYTTQPTDFTLVYLHTDEGEN